MTDGSRFTALAAEDLPGVAGYAFRARIGVGGMGRVYLSFTPGGRAVAVKVVRPDYAADSEFRRRFRAEIFAARRVEGFYTAPVVDADPDADVPWLATAYIPGPTLTEAVRQHGGLPEHTVLRLLAGVAEGLKAVHAVGLVHRDLKPANVLLAADGPRVIDFGIAHAVDATSASLTGKRMGTPAFMAPEQVLNKDIGPAVDVFALGGLACFAATGKTAFGEGMAVFHRITDLAADLEGCPEDLREIIEACLSKDAGSRPSLDEVIAFAREQTSGKTSAYTDSWLPDALMAELGRYDVATAPRPEPRAQAQPTTPIPATAPTPPPTLPLTEVVPPHGAPTRQLRAASPYQGASDQQPATPNRQPAAPNPFLTSPTPEQRHPSSAPPTVAAQLPDATPPTISAPPHHNTPHYNPSATPGYAPTPVYPATPVYPPPRAPRSRAALTATIATVSVLAVVAVVAVATKPWKNSDTIHNSANSSSDSTTSSSQSSSPTTSTSSSVIVVPSTSIVVVSSTTTEPPPTTSHAFDWTDLDTAGSDTTPQNGDALLANDFTDSDGRKYTLEGSGTHPCSNDSETSTVKNILSSNHCSSMVDAAYVNSTGSILVSVEVMTFADKSTADSVENQIQKTSSGDVGWYCPHTGTGSAICHEDISDSVMQEGSVLLSHRYVINADAIYINLATSGNKDALTHAAHAAVTASGPDVYWNTHD